MKDVSQAIIDKEEYAQRQPVEIYHLWRMNGTTHWYYTSGDSPITFDGNLYIPATIERDSVNYNAQLEVSELKVRAAVITDPTQEYIALNPVETIWIDVRKLFRDQSPYESVVIFIGQIKSISFKGSEAQANCVGFEYHLKQQIPIFRYQPQCNNFLFDDFCSLNKANYAVSATIDTIDGTTITSTTFSSYDDGYFSLGHFEWGDYYRHITSHVGDTVIMRYFIPTLTAGQSITIYPGCNLDVVTCRDKFNNVRNFFGHPYIPIKNPVLGV